MKSNVDYFLGKIDDAIDTRLTASGFVLTNNIKDSIRDQGLIDTGQMINDVQFVKDSNEVKAGNTVEHALYQNEGFRHWISGELIGPNRFLQKGASASEGALRVIWQQPIRG